MRRVSLLLLPLSLLMATACTADDGETAAARTPAVPFGIGAPAPAYSATLLDGDSVSLAGMRDRVVLLNVWATWCHPCRTEIPELQALHVKYADRGFSVVGVSVDGDGDEAGIREFVEEYRMTYPIWRDPDERVSALFSVVGVPATYLIDRQGVMRWRTVGPVRPGDTTLVRAIETALAPAS
ncbi:MAG TPA: TlpA disulfide reductase family protein [Gemmatimonas sp.]|nr:TlpA disulfide reductase family protein [Gemmatimonas sp.]